ncbi:MAG: putative zinc-binding metallopeptidase [Planctomycetes bacterium]|nr:putative zinc-binding metallopeptidase [Planctomycetota bacterium]
MTSSADPGASPGEGDRRRQRPPPDAREPIDPAGITEEDLLDTRICDLALSIEGSWIEPRIQALRAELKQSALHFRPHFWLSSDWFTPDGIPGVAIPFYLAHPRLMQLEEKQMLEVEGGTEDWCMRLLRHEVGHAIDNAYHLRRRRRWRQHFGKCSQAYPEFYQPRPFSRRFVIHLDYWYAQSHPSEDFAETFAVWLGQPSTWRKRYQNWPALKKLEYVDQLMKDIAAKEPPNRSRARLEPIHRIRTTLREHYEEKRARYGVGYPDFYDRDLRRLFSSTPAAGKAERAAAFLRRIRPEIRRLVARWTGQYQYMIDQVLKDMIDRSRELNLFVHHPDEQTKLEAAILLAVQTMNYLHGGHHRIAL